MSSKTATFQNVEGDGTQIITIKIDDNGTVTATANKKLSGLKAAKFKYEGGKWVDLNQDARNFLKNEQNKKNINDRLTELVGIVSPEVKEKVINVSGFASNNQNQATSSDKNEETTTPSTPFSFKDTLSSLQNQSVRYPTDHTYFKGRYPINQKDSDDFDHFKITCYDHEPSGLEANQFILPDIDDRK